MGYVTSIPTPPPVWDSNRSQLGNGSADGVATPNVPHGFYGATPVAQQAGTGGSPVSTAPTSTNPYGFATLGQAQQVLNAMLALQKLGLIA